MRHGGVHCHPRSLASSRHSRNPAAFLAGAVGQLAVRNPSRCFSAGATSRHRLARRKTESDRCGGLRAGRDVLVRERNAALAASHAIHDSTPARVRSLDCHYSRCDRCVLHRLSKTRRFSADGFFASRTDDRVRARVSRSPVGVE